MSPPTQQSRAEYVIRNSADQEMNRVYTEALKGPPTCLAQCLIQAQLTALSYRHLRPLGPFHTSEATNGWPVCQQPTDFTSDFCCVADLKVQLIYA